MILKKARSRRVKPGRQVDLMAIIRASVGWAYSKTQASSYQAEIRSSALLA